MEPKPARRKQLRRLTCPECQQRGLFRTILWGMPDPESFDFDNYAVGGCCPPSVWPPDCRYSGCGFEGYRDVISGQGLGHEYSIQRRSSDFLEQGIATKS
jgi:hypothetical protein